ncbi:MAG TPA: ABC transporter substrate-binding protein [Thermomicrobiales bacterium]|nr:ABC transporter substrate-binding protein [Thermomicrobiales bacterium]
MTASPDPRRALTNAATRRDVLKGAAALGLAAASLPVVGSVPAGAAPARQTDAKTLTIAVNGSATNLDPHASYEYRSTLAIRGPFEGLIALDGGAMDKYVGVLAESWSPNADKSVWTFKIRKGVTFQDGTPCDAEACRLSFERFLTMGLGPVNVIGRFVADPKQITAPDAQTLVFDLKKPQPIFEAAVSAQYGPLIVNAKVAKEHEDNGDWGTAWAATNSDGLGTGPYTITDFEPGSSLQMARYEKYWHGWDGSEFDNIVIRVVEEDATRRQLIEQGGVDIVDNLTPEALQALEKNPDVVVDAEYNTEVMYLTLTEGGSLKTPEARQAMCAAFPYDEVITGVYKGYGKRSIGPVAELCRGFAPDTPTIAADLDKAKELFAKAGVAEGTTISLMQENGDENLKAATQLFQANLAKIGITLDIQSVDYATASAMFYGDAPVDQRPAVMSGFWWPDYNDAYNHLYPQVACASWGSKGSNAGFYCNKQVDADLATAKNAVDDATYMKSLADAQKILSAEDPSAIYYMQPKWTTILRNDIEGFVFNPIYQGTYDFYRLRRKA